VSRSLVRKPGVAWMAAGVMLLFAFAAAFHGMQNDPSSGDFDHTVAGIPRKLLPLLVGATLCGIMGGALFVAEWRKKGSQ
jgi:hypothetical protein